MARKGKRQRPERHKQSLTEQIEDPENNGVRAKSSFKRQKPDEEDALALDEKTTEKIMKGAREQQEEIDAEENAFLASARRSKAQGTVSAADVSDSDSDEDATQNDFSEFGSVWEEEAEITPEDEAAMAAFLNPIGGVKQRTLADIILEKIKEKEERSGQGTAEEPRLPGPPAMDDKVVAVYKGVAQIMKRYSAGKVPKAFKIIPKLQNWEEVLWLTEPQTWSPQAVFQATRMFISNLNARLAQRFLALVLLPHVREDIQTNKRLHFALFQAMKKAAFKPDAFYKGLLLPLCRSGDCTVREAVIVSSVLNRVSIPVVHSGAALLRLAEMPYSGTTSFFVRVLLDKKYALPYRVIDGLVDHFLRFQEEQRTLPVVWHQSLLAFLQRYKHEIRKEDQGQLRKLLRTQYHYQITPEIHREMEAARARGEKPVQETQKLQQIVSGKSSEDIRTLPPVFLMEED